MKKATLFGFLLMLSYFAFAQIPMSQVPDSIKKNGFLWVGYENYSPDGQDAKNNGQLDYQRALKKALKPSDMVFFGIVIQNIENRKTEGQYYYWVSPENNPSELYLIVANKIIRGVVKGGNGAFIAKFQGTTTAILTNPMTAEETETVVPTFGLVIGSQDDLKP